MKKLSYYLAVIFIILINSSCGFDPNNYQGWAKAAGNSTTAPEHLDNHLGNIVTVDVAEDNEIEEFTVYCGGKITEGDSVYISHDEIVSTK